MRRHRESGERLSVRVESGRVGVGSGAMGPGKGGWMHIESKRGPRLCQRRMNFEIRKIQIVTIACFYHAPHSYCSRCLHSYV